MCQAPCHGSESPVVLPSANRTHTAPAPQTILKPMQTLPPAGRGYACVCVVCVHI